MFILNQNELDMRGFYTILFFLLIGCISCDKSENSLKPNATIIGFNPDKCYCCWGWTIKTGIDTIKSDDIIIGETIGYNITYPVTVYIEIGELKNKCSDSGFTNSDFYKVIKIEKMK